MKFRSIWPIAIHTRYCRVIIKAWKLFKLPPDLYTRLKFRNSLIFRRLYLGSDNGSVFSLSLKGRKLDRCPAIFLVKKASEFRSVSFVIDERLAIERIPSGDGARRIFHRSREIWRRKMRTGTQSKVNNSNDRVAIPRALEGEREEGRGRRNLAPRIYSKFLKFF